MKLDKKTKDFVKDETIDESTAELTTKKIRRPRKYIVLVDNLAIRAGAGLEFALNGVAEPGQTLIDDIENNYGHLADKSGWVCMDYVRKVN